MANRGTNAINRGWKMVASVRFAPGGKPEIAQAPIVAQDARLFFFGVGRQVAIRLGNLKASPRSKVVERAF